ncbi:MAG TPA: L,D-transpeptidase, partial [Acidimicrobiia bacterium]|nr:L,D-transpeptidase [Acidimicrobiia bacterium]
GIGTRDTPTPGGIFYIKELLQPPNPRGAYGPYAFGLSGFSNVLESFAGGDGVIGIHGTNDPTTVGKDVSHGCIRLRNEDLLELVERVPLGTPVAILD